VACRAPSSRPYPSSVSVWDEVRQALLDLERTGALTVYPDPRVTEARLPPMAITLAPRATDAADDLTPPLRS
jgi:hypothetical protein